MLQESPVPPVEHVQSELLDITRSFRVGSTTDKSITALCAKLAKVPALRTVTLNPAFTIRVALETGLKVLLASSPEEAAKIAKDEQKTFRF